MIEIRIHGRGGQGGVTLAKIIATSRFLRGDSAQAFGLYAAERSGAPIQAFCRYDAEPIAERNLIYEPDHLIVLDPTLAGPAILTGLKANGWILVNSTQPARQLADDHDFGPFRVATVDATAIARAHGLGTRTVPIVNTALAGAAGRVLGLDLDQIRAALEHLGFVGGNLLAAGEAYEQANLCRFPIDPQAATTPVPRPPTGRGASFVTGAGGEPPGIRTGAWATERPKRQTFVPPCNHVCPAGNDVQGFLAALAEEQVDRALEILLETTPLPAVCGRVCPAPCMDNCNRLALDGAVNVRQLERYAGDHGSVQLPRPDARPECVAIVGSGPAGLTAAYHLARFGHPVTVFEAAPNLGGLLRSGIPEYRLPEDVLDRELQRIRDLGVHFETDHPIDRTVLLALARSHDAVLVATGLQELSDLRLGSGDSPRIEQGIEFLDRARRGRARVAGERVTVVGGGNTAIDAARTALRLGASSVRILYRRSRAEMPAIAEEVRDAEAEGVILDLLTQPVSVAENEVLVLGCRRMELGEPDESGRRSPVEIEGSDFQVEADRMILALGQSADLAIFPDGTEVREGERLLGLLEKPVFAIGDLATSDGTVAGAIGSGRRAARHIQETLAGALPPPAARGNGDRRPTDVRHDRVITADELKLHLFERRGGAAGAELLPARRRSTFEEVHQGLADTEEAKRCLSCGVCNECDRCLTYCPEGVLKRVGHELVFDYSFCKGCSICAAECPRNVIFMSHL